MLQQLKWDPDALYDAKEYLLARNITVSSERSDIEGMDDAPDADDASVIKPYDPSKNRYFSQKLGSLLISYHVCYMSA